MKKVNSNNPDLNCLPYSPSKKYVQLKVIQQNSLPCSQNVKDKPSIKPHQYIVNIPVLRTSKEAAVKLSLTSSKEITRKLPSPILNQLTGKLASPALREDTQKLTLPILKQSAGKNASPTLNQSIGNLSSPTLKETTGKLASSNIQEATLKIGLPSPVKENSGELISSKIAASDKGRSTNILRVNAEKSHYTYPTSKHIGREMIVGKVSSFDLSESTTSTEEDKMNQLISPSSRWLSQPRSYRGAKRENNTQRKFIRKMPSFVDTTDGETSGMGSSVDEPIESSTESASEAPPSFLQPRLTSRPPTSSPSALKKRRGGWPKGRKRKPELPGTKPPKAPLTGYVLFLNERRKFYKDTQSHLLFGEVTKLLGAEWSSMTSEQKAVYLNRSEQERRRYRNELQSYRQSHDYQLQLRKKRIKNAVIPRGANTTTEESSDFTDEIDDDDSEELYCRTCEQWFSSIHNKREHLYGKHHIQAMTSEYQREREAEERRQADTTSSRESESSSKEEEGVREGSPAGKRNEEKRADTSEGESSKYDCHSSRESVGVAWPSTRESVGVARSSSHESVGVAWSTRESVGATLPASHESVSAAWSTRESVGAAWPTSRESVGLAWPSSRESVGVASTTEDDHDEDEEEDDDEEREYDEDEEEEEEEASEGAREEPPLPLLMGEEGTERVTDAAEDIMNKVLGREKEVRFLRRRQEKARLAHRKLTASLMVLKARHQTLQEVQSRLAAEEKELLEKTQTLQNIVGVIRSVAAEDESHLGLPRVPEGSGGRLPVEGYGRVSDCESHLGLPRVPEVSAKVLPGEGYGRVLDCESHLVLPRVPEGSAGGLSVEEYRRLSDLLDGRDEWSGGGLDRSVVPPLNFVSTAEGTCQWIRGESSTATFAKPGLTSSGARPKRTSSPSVGFGMVGDNLLGHNHSPSIDSLSPSEGENLRQRFGSPEPLPTPPDVTLHLQEEERNSWERISSHPEEEHSYSRLSHPSNYRRRRKGAILDPVIMKKVMEEEELEPALLQQVVTEKQVEPTLLQQMVTEKQVEPTLLQQMGVEKQLKPTLLQQMVEKPVEPTLLQQMVEKQVEPTLLQQVVIDKQVESDACLDEAIKQMENNHLDEGGTPSVGNPVTACLTPSNGYRTTYATPSSKALTNYATPPIKGPANYSMPPIKGPANATPPIKDPANYTTPPIKAPTIHDTTSIKGPANYPTPPIKGPANYPTPPIKGPANYPTPPIKGPANYATPPIKVPTTPSTAPIKDLSTSIREGNIFQDQEILGISECWSSSEDTSHTTQDYSNYQRTVRCNTSSDNFRNCSTNLIGDSNMHLDMSGYNSSSSCSSLSSITTNTNSDDNILVDLHYGSRDTSIATSTNIKEAPLLGCGSGRSNGKVGRSTENGVFIPNADEGDGSNSYSDTTSQNEESEVDMGLSSPSGRIRYDKKNRLDTDYGSSSTTNQTGTLRGIDTDYGSCSTTNQTGMLGGVDTDYGSSSTTNQTGTLRGIDTDYGSCSTTNQTGMLGGVDTICNSNSPTSQNGPVSDRDLSRPCDTDEHQYLNDFDLASLINEDVYLRQLSLPLDPHGGLPEGGELPHLQWEYVSSSSNSRRRPYESHLDTLPTFDYVLDDELIQLLGEES